MYGKETDIPDPNSIFLSWGKPETKSIQVKSVFQAKSRRA